MPFGTTIDRGALAAKRMSAGASITSWKLKVLTEPQKPGEKWKKQRTKEGNQIIQPSGFGVVSKCFKHFAWTWTPDSNIKMSRNVNHRLLQKSSNASAAITLIIVVFSSLKTWSIPSIKTHAPRIQGWRRLSIQWLINCCDMAMAYGCVMAITVVSVVAIWTQPHLSWDAEGASEASSHPSHALFHEVLSEALSKCSVVQSSISQYKTRQETKPACGVRIRQHFSIDLLGRGCNFDQKRISCKIHAVSLNAQNALPMTMSKVWDSPGPSRYSCRVGQCMKRKTEKDENIITKLNCDYAHEPLSSTAVAFATSAQVQLEEALPISHAPMHQCFKFNNVRLSSQRQVSFNSAKECSFLQTSPEHEFHWLIHLVLWLHWELEPNKARQVRWQFVKFWAENVASSSEESMSTSSFRGFGRRRSWRSEPVGLKSTDLSFSNCFSLHFEVCLNKSAQAQLFDLGFSCFTMFYIHLSPGCAASGSHGSPALVVPRGADPGRPHAALDQDLGTQNHEAEEPKGESWEDK